MNLNGVLTSISSRPILTVYAVQCSSLLNGAFQEPRATVTRNFDGMKISKQCNVKRGRIPFCGVMLDGHVEVVCIVLCVNQGRDLRER